MSSTTRTHYRTCNLCEAMCGIRIDLENDRIVSIRGDELDPFSRGHICPKAVALQDLHNDPDRLKQPVRRTSTGWEEISWEMAFDETAAQIKRIQKQSGNDSVAIYLGNPTVHNYGSILYGLPFIRALKTHNRYSATSLDQLPHHLVAFLMFGHQLLLPVPDIDRTNFLVIMGANPLVSNGSMMSAPDVKKRLEDIRKRGGKIHVIDPRKTETAAIADQHHFIRPGSDALFMLGILHTIFSEKLQKPGRLTGRMDGIERMEQLASEFPPESVAQITGVEATKIRKLAREFCASTSAVWYGRIGVSIQEFGALTQWLIHVVNIVTGNLDSPGGAMFTKPAVDILVNGALVSRGQYGRHFSRVRKLPAFSGEYPVSTLADEILEPGAGQVKALITSAGNPVISSPNAKQLEHALSKLEFMACIDFYINETTRHANIILPPTSSLEHDNYDLALHLLAIRNTAKYSPALYPPSKGAKHDWEIFLELQKRLENKRVLHWILKKLGPAGVLNIGLLLGPYHLTLKKLKREVHGSDFGPLRPCLPERLFTPGKRIHLAPEPLVDDISRLKEKIRSHKNSNGHFLLIGRRQLRSNNSWMHNFDRLVKGKSTCTLLIHPNDASRMNISNGESVKIQSRTGSVQVLAEISSDVMAGVVSLPHGWGHHREGIRLGVASKHAGNSINDVTDDQQIDALSGNAALNGVPVTLSKS